MSEWKLVPETPSREMLNAAIDTDRFKLGDISPLGFRCSPQMMFERSYKAMLSASPPPVIDTEMLDRAELAFKSVPRSKSIRDAVRAALTAALGEGK